MTQTGRDTTHGPGRYLFEDDYVDESFDRAATTPEEMRKAAHLANGGEQTFTCPACRGTGAFHSYTGRYVGQCFKCKGRKTISKGQAAAIKGKATKEANKAKWAADHAAEIAYIDKRVAKGSNYYLGFKTRLDAHGNLFDTTVEKIRADMAADAEFYAKRKAEREAARPVVPTEAIQALFDRAEVKLVKTPIFRTTEITINQAPGTGRNPGALYVKDTETKEYLGKIVAGRWHPKWGTRDITPALQAVAADPTAEAIKYARKYKACCICGQTLRNPVSALAVVGPVCGPRWGLDHLRMEAAAMLAAEAKAEKEG